MKRRLPKSLWAAHEYAFFLHDHLVSLVKVGEELEVFDPPLEMGSKEHADLLQGLEEEAALEWLVSNGYRDQLHEVAFRRIFVGLLADMCNFIYEGLKCSEKGKLTVAFSLFRKPFKDNLFLLEWLLTDRTDLLNRFHGSLPKRMHPIESRPRESWR